MAKKKKKKKSKQKTTKTPIIAEPVSDEEITRLKKQAQFIQVFFVIGNNVSKTCETIGIERNTYYRWLRTDPAFKAKIYDCLEGLKDYAEAMIIKAMPDDWRAALAWLKIHAKDRGWKPDIALANEEVETERIIIEHIYGKVPPKRKQIESKQLKKGKKNEQS